MGNYVAYFEGHGKIRYLDFARDDALSRAKAHAVRIGCYCLSFGRLTERETMANSHEYYRRYPDGKNWMKAF